jgi:hypothetical protein
VANTRKQYSDQFKFKVALEAVKGVQTINEIAGGHHGLVQPLVLTWKLSNTLDGAFCPEALGLAWQHSRPDSVNTDQGDDSPPTTLPMRGNSEDMRYEDSSNRSCGYSRQ